MGEHRQTGTPRSVPGHARRRGALDLVGEDLTFTDAFAADLRRLEDRTGDLDRDALRSAVTSAPGSKADVLLEVTEKTPSIAAKYLALAERTDLSHLKRLQALSLFDMFLNPPPEVGAPEAFVSVSGQRLPFHMALQDKALVYVWHHDCPPCDSVRDDFDEPLEDLAIFAVYGTDTAAKLYEWYDVVVGPETLFFHRGRSKRGCTVRTTGPSSKPRSSSTDSSASHLGAEGPLRYRCDSG